MRGDRPGVVLNYGGKGKSAILFSTQPASSIAVTRLAATFDGKTLTLYQAAESVGNVQVPNPRPKGQGQLSIGQRPNGLGTFTNGQIHYIGLWNKVLTTNEIASLPLNTNVHSNPVFQWSRNRKTKNVAIDFEEVRQRAGLESTWKK